MGYRMVVVMYFDPGTGSLVIQLLLASLAGITSFWVVFKNNIADFFSKLKKKKDSKDDDKK